MKTETAERELSVRLCGIESLFFPCKGVEIEVEIREELRGKFNFFSEQINFVTVTHTTVVHNDTCAIFVKIKKIKKCLLVPILVFFCSQVFFKPMSCSVTF